MWLTRRTMVCGQEAASKAVGSVCEKVVNRDRISAAFPHRRLHGTGRAVAARCSAEHRETEAKPKENLCITI